jgi:hypothetical protein
VPDYVQQLWEGYVQLQNSFDQLQQRVVGNDMATQEQINQLAERVEGLKTSLTHSQSEIRTELDRLSGQGVDTSGLESALDSLAQEVQATEDIIPDGGGTPEPGPNPPDNPSDITAPPLGVDPEAPPTSEQPPSEQPPADAGEPPAEGQPESHPDNPTIDVGEPANAPAPEGQPVEEPPVTEPAAGDPNATEGPG